jgi:hypothetical protein
MSSYSIDPAGVSAVVKDVQDAAGALVEAFSSLESAETDVTNGTSDCAEVAAAVSALLQREAPRMTTVGNRISACLLGVATATADYVAADDTMSDDVRAAQTHAVESAGSGDFSWFTDRSGVQR